MTVGVEKLAGVAAGDTVRARYKTKNGIVEVCSKVVADDATNWFYLALPGHDRIGLRQTVTDSTHGDLVEVVSVVKPPYAEGTDDPEPRFGDVVEADRPSVGFPTPHRWMFVGDGWLATTRTVTESPKYVERSFLPERLRLVRRLQDWPVIDRKWDSDEEFAEQFATAQRLMATKIRGLRSAGNVDHNSALDEAARVVEHFDLDDAYPGDD